MSKFIVTGGAGFIGSHIVERLLADNHSVIVIDNLSTGNLAYLPKDDKVKFVQLDIGNWTEMSKAFSYWKGVDGVFHLAACARIQPSIHQPLITNDANVVGTLNVLEMMRMCGVTNIVYSASSSYYGRKVTLPCHESASPDCQTPYSATKYMGELYCKTWGNLYGIRNVALRYFNVYGRRSPVDGQYAPVIGLFFKQAITGLPLTVIGDGEQKRDFTHVADVVKANLYAMTDLLRGKEISGHVINIGTGTNYSINQVALMVKNVLETLKIYTTIKHAPERPGESRETLADNRLAQDAIGWIPTVSLEDGVNDLARYYIDNARDLFGSTPKI